MHNKSVVVAISFILSVGGWFLWNILLAAIYQNNVIYYVKDNFFDGFGRSALWWLTLILILASVIIYELGVASLRATIWPTDVSLMLAHSQKDTQLKCFQVDTFQALEQDLDVRKRFEEAAAMELQQGWNRGEKKSSLDIQRGQADQAAREGEVQEMLENRPGEMEEGRASMAGRRSLDIQEMISRRFGSVRRNELS